MGGNSGRTACLLSSSQTCIALVQAKIGECGHTTRWSFARQGTSKESGQEKTVRLHRDVVEEFFHSPMTDHRGQREDSNLQM